MLAPLRDPTTQRALLELALLGIAGGAVGCWIVLQGLAYGAESLAHALLPGLVVAALLGLPLLLGGAAGLLVAAVAVALAGRIEVIGRDTAVAVVVTTLFGAGVLLALAPGTPLGLRGLLFGEVLAARDGDLLLAGGLAVVVAAVLWAGHHSLLAAGFDRAAARAAGRNPLVADLVLVLLLALVLLVAVPALGNLLVVALLVGPAMAARVLARRLAPMLAVASIAALVAATAGIYASYHLRIAAGAAVAGALALAPAAALLFRPLGAGSRRSGRAG
jgi:ABC-type Mn2+/Zn2+ transport system permease subunit